jgi:predicted Fe-Mo cluster-binding NifX family protein
MRIAITSQNFRTVTGHAGKARRFLVFDCKDANSMVETQRLDLPLEMAFHGFDDRFPHPLDGVDILISGGAGEGFVQRMLRRGIQVVATGETDPLTAVRAFLAGTLKPPGPHDHDLEGGEEGHSCGCHH